MLKTNSKQARTAEEVTAAIIEFFKNNEDVFNDCMEELDEFYRDTRPIDLLYRTFYGHDDDTWTTDASGNKTYGEFNPNRTYFYYNGYGNLVSSDYKDYTVHLDHYAVEEMSENRHYINSIEDDEELIALFDELEKAE